MADYTPSQGEQIPNSMRTRYKDMGDGTHAMTVYVGAGGLDVSGALPAGDNNIGNVDIGRTYQSGTATIANGQALSGTIDMRGYAGLILMMPSGWTAADIGFYVCATADGAFLPYYDKDGSLVAISSPAANRALEVPSALFPAFFVKLWSQNAGADENQGGDRSIVYMLKG